MLKKSYKFISIYKVHHVFLPVFLFLIHQFLLTYIFNNVKYLSFVLIAHFFTFLKAFYKIKTVWLNNIERMLNQITHRWKKGRS